MRQVLHKLVLSLHLHLCSTYQEFPGLVDVKVAVARDITNTDTGEPFLGLFTHHLLEEREHLGEETDDESDLEVDDDDAWGDDTLLSVQGSWVVPEWHGCSVRDKEGLHLFGWTARKTLMEGDQLN